MQHGDVHSVSNSGYSNAEREKSNEKKMRNSLKKTDKSQSDENIAQNRETSNARMKLWLSSKKRRTNARTLKAMKTTAAQTATTTTIPIDYA